MTIVLPHWWWIAAIAVYVVGAVVTFYVNMIDVVYITRPMVIVRNVVFWPVFLPALIILLIMTR